MTDYAQIINPGDDEPTQVSKALLSMYAINDNIKYGILRGMRKI
jgi:hypothetical protein